MVLILKNYVKKEMLFSISLNYLFYEIMFKLLILIVTNIIFLKKYNDLICNS